MNALEALNAGKLTQALQLATDAARAAPDDAGARFVLAELLCFQGDFERADNLLDAASTLDPTAGMAVAQFRQIIRGEVARQDCFAAGRPPQLVVDATPELRERLAALVALRGAEGAAAQAALERAEGLRQRRSGSCNGTPFDDFRDADDLVAAVLEVLTGDGRYFWVPFELVRSIEFEKPRRARDLLFRQAHLEADGGLAGEVFIPALYAGTCSSEREDLRLGRATDWSGPQEGPVRGIGQRIFLAGEEAPGLLDITELSFSAG